MTTSKRQQQIQRALAITAALLIAICAWVPAIQDMANSQVDAGLKRSLITFASARALNAVISVVQGTELSVQPLGVGVTLTLGQVLDPINDLMEQFSSLMLIASVAFGIQKVLLAIGAHWLISAMVTGFAVAWATLKWLDKSPPWMTRVMLVLMMVRFAIPVVTIGSDFLFHQFMAQDYAESTKVLEKSAQEVKGLADRTSSVYVTADTAPAKEAVTPQVSASAPPAGASAPSSSIYSKLKGAIGIGGPSETDDAEKGSVLEKVRDRVASKLPSFASFDAIKNSLESLTERIIKLIVVFLAQTILIPLVLMWALYIIVLGVIRPTQARGLGG